MYITIYNYNIFYDLLFANFGISLFGIHVFAFNYQGRHGFLLPIFALFHRFVVMHPHWWRNATQMQTGRKRELGLGFKALDLGCNIHVCQGTICDTRTRYMYSNPSFRALSEPERRSRVVLYCGIVVVVVRESRESQ